MTLTMTFEEKKELRNYPPDSIKFKIHVLHYFSRKKRKQLRTVHSISDLLIFILLTVLLPVFCPYIYIQLSISTFYHPCDTLKIYLHY